MRIARTVRFALVGLAALALATAVPASVKSTEVPVTKQVGKTVVVYKDARLDIVVSYRFAKQNPGGNWLLLDTFMTANRDPVAIKRAEVTLLTPDGTIIPLASQELFGSSYPGMAAAVARANAMREPLGYLPPQRVRRLSFFTEPGRGLAFPEVWLDQWHNTLGRLYFQIPGGVQPGTYQLRFTLKDEQAAVSFEL
jgi:hypothetical protein